MPDDEIHEWFKGTLAALSDVEGHMHKRLELMTRALVPATSGEFLVFKSPPLEYCEEKAGALFAAAWKDDADAVAALSLIASALLWRGKHLPPMLATTMSVALHERGTLKPKRRRGRHSPYDLVTRDIAIIRRIQKVCAACGLPATRNDAEKDGGKPSGCSVVGEELDINERVIEDAWRKRKQYGIL